MASITWDFGPTGFSVVVRSRDGGQSSVTGTNAVDELCVTLSTPSNAVATSTGTDSTPISRMLATPGTTIITSMAVDVDVSMSFRDDDGYLDASWRVGPYSISGKGKGKGLGKNTTIVPQR